MKNQFLILVIISFLSFSCTTDKDDVSSEVIWVDSIRVNCTGVGEQTCYRIQENDTINENEWLLFYNPIEDFDQQYQTGFVYKISVSKIVMDNPLADANSIKYVLNNIISKELDK